MKTFLLALFIFVPLVAFGQEKQKTLDEANPTELELAKCQRQLAAVQLSTEINAINAKLESKKEPAEKKKGKEAKNDQ